MNGLGPSLMRAALPALLFVAACGAPKPKVDFTEGVELTQFHRVGVAPFKGKDVDAKAAQQGVLRAFANRSLSIVDPDQLKSALAGLTLDGGDRISMEEWLHIRQATGADVVVFGTVEAQKKGRRRLSLILLETENGESAAKASLVVEDKDPFGMAGAAERLVAALQGALDVRPLPEAE